MSADFSPDAIFVLPKSQAHVWVRDGQPMLTIISNAPDDMALNWPEQNGPVMIFDGSFEVTVTVVQP